MKNEVYLIDCMKFMEKVPDKYYDLSLVDPPYGINVNKMNMGGRYTIRPTDKEWDDEIPNQQYFDELMRVSKEQIIWGGNYFPLRPSRCFVIWDKGEMMYGRSFAECEFAWVSFDKSAKIYKLNPTQLDRIHPTQKPIALYLWLLNNYAKQGDKIFDSHVGSGSSRIACDKLGYYFEGCELDPDYWKAQEKRYKDYKSQLTLQL